MTNATVFDAKAWEWNKDSLTIMEMQAAELQVLCTRYNLKPAKTNKAAATTAIVNQLMVPRADVVMKQDVHNAIEVTMEQVVKNILALAMEAKIVTVIGQVKTLQNKVDEMAKSFDTMQDSGEKWKEVVGRKVDKVANKVDRATDVDLVKAREANIRVTGLTMSKGETSKQLMELVQTELLDRLKVADRVQVQKMHRQMPSGRLDKATDKASVVIIMLASVHDKLMVLRTRKGLQGIQLGLNEDLTPTQQAQKRAAWATFKEAKEAGEQVYWCGADLYINHKVVNFLTAQGGGGQRDLRVCLWNIHGAAITKLETHEHLLDLFQHVDVVALTETHHFPSNTFPVLPGFCCFDVARPVTPQGVVRKHSGGIAVLVKETWANSIAVWKTARDGTRIWLRLGNAFQRPLFLCIVYAAPQGSPYADNNLFEHICQEVGEAMNSGGVLFVEDFNARTGTNTDFIDCSQLADVLLVPQAIEDTLPNDMLER